jgi:hypothetical protein
MVSSNVVIEVAYVSPLSWVCAPAVLSDLDMYYTFDSFLHTNILHGKLFSEVSQSWSSMRVSEEVSDLFYIN